MVGRILRAADVASPQALMPLDFRGIMCKDMVGGFTNGAGP